MNVPDTRSISKRVHYLNQTIAFEESTQDDFLEKTEWSPAYWLSHWHSGQVRPDGEELREAKEWMALARQKEERGDFEGAYRFLDRAEQKSKESGCAWLRYVEGTRESSEAGEELVWEVVKGAAYAEVAGVVGIAGAWAVTSGAAAALWAEMAAAAAAFKAALPQMLPAASSKLGTMASAARDALTSPVYWQRFAKLGSISAAIRGGYDLFDAEVLGNQKDAATVSQNVAQAFIGGGLCGGIFSGLLSYNYVGLDVLGDFSAKYLVDVRKQHGDMEGAAMAGGFLLGENVLAAASFVPYLGSVGKAAKTALIATAISIGLETYLQRSNGREWEDLDPGRFVGMSAWGHSVVLLPEAILSGAQAAAVGFAGAVEKATELGVKYVAFVNPSASNFQARVSEQNWVNVQIGNTLRHSTMMMLSRLIQALLRPAHPAAMIADETIGAASIAMVDAIWPFYEDIPGFESKPMAKNKEENEGMAALLQR